MTDILKIEYAITSNAPPFDQPWPPALMGGWHLVRSDNGRTTWRRITLKTSNDLLREGTQR